MKKATTSGDFTPLATVKDYIKNKFSNVTRFAILAGYENTHEVHNILKSGPGERLEQVYAKAKSIKNRPTKFEITRKDVDDLFIYVGLHHAGNLAEFVRKHSVDYPTTYKMINGRIIAKTPFVKEILKVIRPEGKEQENETGTNTKL